MTIRIEKETLRDKIAEILRELISEGGLRPGDRINESALAMRLGVSRAPLREALCLLANRGLVRVEKNRGAFVTRLDRADIDEIFELRTLLETHVARKIRARPHPDAAAALTAALAVLARAARARDVGAFSDADLEFHRTVWRLGGNRHEERLLDDLATRFFGYELVQDLPHGHAFRFDEVYSQHERMVTLALGGSDEALVAGYREIFAAFYAYVLERFGFAD